MYHSGLPLHIKPFFGHLPPQKLTTDTLREYRDRDPAKERKKPEDRLVQRNLALRTEDEWQTPPLGSLLPHAQRGKRPDWIPSGGKFKELHEALPHAGAKALAAASFYTGVRKGELTKVNWDQVDFEVRSVTSSTPKARRCSLTKVTG